MRREKGKDVAATFRDSLTRPIPWLDAFDIDSGVLDVEHKWLIEALNHACLETAHCPSRGRKAVAELDIPGLIATHFTNEERLFDQLDYADSTQHRQEHDRIRRLSAPLLGSDTDDSVFAQGLLQARTGLVEHLIRHDLGFKSHLLYQYGK